MRAWALLGIVVNVGILLTGAVVRLTQSGLGCPSWPRCTGESLVPVPHAGTPALNMVIEFGNRMLSSVVLTVAACCAVAALRFVPRRRALVWLGWAQLLGVITQALLGGLTVLTGLHPATVAAHYLVSAAIIAAAVALYERSREGDAPPRLLVRREVGWLARSLLAAVGAVLVLGTVVTGTGPHGGDPSSPRFDLSIQQVAQLHADAVWATLGLTFALLLAVRLTEAPLSVRRRAGGLLVLELAQGAVGYVQYFLGVPEALVWVHVLGSALVWIAAWRVYFSLRDRGPVPVAPEARPQAAARSAAGAG